LKTRRKALFDVNGIHPNIKVAKGTKLDLLRIWAYLNKEKFGTRFGPWEGPHSSKWAVNHRYKHSIMLTSY
jgi:hypothetical protein